MGVWVGRAMENCEVRGLGCMENFILGRLVDGGMA